MTNGYIELSVPTDRDTLIQTAFANLSNGLPGWQPREGNLDVLLIEQFAEMAADAAEVAANVPLSIFSYYGQLLGITQNTGTPMQIATTWTLSTPSSGGLDFPAGTIASVYYNGSYYQFQTDEDLAFNSGDTSSTVNMTAVTSNSAFNILYSGLYLQPLYYVPNLGSIQINSIVTAAIDSETSENYLDRLSSLLTAYTPRPILSNDYATLAAQVAGVGRATAYDNTDPLVNLLPVNVATPTASGWSAVNGSTVATDSLGQYSVTASVAPLTSGSLASFTSPASPAVAAASTFLPFKGTATTSAVTYTTSTTSIALTNTGTSPFPNSAGVGYVQNTDGSLTKFTYTGATTSGLTGVVFPFGGSYSNGALIAYAGNSAFNVASVIGTVISISDGTNSESAFIKGVTVNQGATIGWTVASLAKAYNTSTAITYKLASGATTGAISISSDSLFVRANVMQQLASGGTLATCPALVATAIYEDGTTAYFASDLSLSENSAFPSMLDVIVPGVSPIPYVNTGNNIADPNVPLSFARGVASVALTVYYPGATTTKRHLELASLVLDGGNVVEYKDGAWVTGSTIAYEFGTNNPTNIIPDGKFESVYPKNVSTTTTAGVTISGSTTPNTISVTSVAGAPSAGMGVLSNGSSSAYFFYTGTTPTSVTGVTWSTTSGSFLSGSTVSFAAPVQNAQQWTVSSTPYGTVAPLSALGVQFIPAATSLGGAQTITSAIFNLPAGTYFLDAVIDATALNSGSSLPTISVVNATTNTAITGLTITAIAGQKTRNNPTPSLATVGSTTPAYVQITFPISMSSVAGRSVIIDNLQLIPWVGSLGSVASNYTAAVDGLGPVGAGPTWTPGGYSAWNSISGSASANKSRSVMVAVTDPEGMRPTSSLIQSVQNYLQSFRELNFNVAATGPNYQIIDINYTVVAAQGYDPSALQDSILTHLEELLSPTAWAGGLASPSYWDSTQGTIRYLDVISRLDDADGVANIINMTMCVHGGTFGTSDIVLSGLACLPILGNVNGTVSTSTSSVLEVN